MIIACVIAVLIIIGAVFAFSQVPISMNLLENNDISVLHRAGIIRLELSRYRKTVYVNHVPRRKKINLDAQPAVSTVLYASIEDELELVGYKKSLSEHVGKFPYLICVYPYSDENKAKLLEIIENYKQSK